MATLIRPKKKTAPDYWVIQWMEDGRKRYHTLGRMPRQEAEQHLREFNARQVLNMQPVIRDDGSETLDYLWLEVYAPILARKAPSTQALERLGMGHIRRLWPGIRVNQITPARIEEYKTQRLAEDVRSRTINLELKVLRLILKAAEMQGFLPGGMPVVTPLRMNDSRPAVFLTLEQANRLQSRLLEMADEASGRYPSVVAVLMALHTGMRSGEVLTRQREDIDWDVGEHGVIRVGHKPEIDWRVKCGRERMSPLTERLSAELRRFLRWQGETGGWLFRHNCQGFLYQLAEQARLISVKEPMTVRQLAGALVGLRPLSHRTEPWRYTVAHGIQRHRKMFIHKAHGVWQGRQDYSPTPTRRMKSFRRTLVQACEAAKVPILHQHALRHCWATLALAGGMDIRAVQELGGWKNPDVPLKIYAHVSTGHALSAVQKFPLGRIPQGTVIQMPGRGESQSG